MTTQRIGTITLRKPLMSDDEISVEMRGFVDSPMGIREKDLRLFGKVIRNICNDAHWAKVNDLRATIATQAAELAQLKREKQEAISIIQSLGLPIEDVIVETITRKEWEGGDHE